MFGQPFFYLMAFFTQSQGWFYTYGGPMEQMITQWAQMGVFNILLPFVLVFSIVFAILEKVKLLNNSGVHVIISLVVAFFTIANQYVVSFFIPLFSNLGLGVAILISLVILVGLAINPGEKAWKTIFIIMGIILFIVLLARSNLLEYILPFNKCDPYCQGVVVFLVVVAIAVIGALALGKKEEPGASPLGGK